MALPDNSVVQLATNLAESASWLTRVSWSPVKHQALDRITLTARGLHAAIFLFLNSFGRLGNYAGRWPSGMANALSIGRGTMGHGQEKSSGLAG